MKVLWLSNCALNNVASSGSGSWLFAMRDLITKSVELVNITECKVEDITVSESNGVKQYLLPNWKKKGGIPSLENIERIAEIIKKEAPDIIHIWGVEKYWALLFSRGYIRHDKVLLEMQGVISACADVFYGGLTPKECRMLHSIKSALFKWSRLSFTFRSFQEKSKYEAELIRDFRNIAVQSEWTKEQLSTICSNSTSFYYSLRPIRQEFYEAPKWEKKKHDNPVVFCSLSYYVPFKGFHFLLKALPLLKQQYPGIVLRIAGPDLANRRFYDVKDYERFVLKEIKRLGLQANIYFCGSLKAPQIIDEILNSDVVVNPSLVESYSAAAAESLFLGAPTVLGFAGAMVNFTEDKPVALYYNPMDYRSLAAKINLLIEDDELRKALAKNAIETLTRKCSPERVKQRQLDTYHTIISEL